MATYEYGLKTKVKTGGPSPELKANVLSYFTWQWVQPLINLGNEKPLQMEDLYDLLPREKTAFCERMWNKCWEKHIREKGRPPSVWRLMFVSAGREMIFSFLACPIWLVAVVSQVFVLKALVEVAANSDEHLPWWRGFLLVFGMMCTSIALIISQHYTFTAGQKSGMKIKSAVSMAVFNKHMKLKTVALAGTSSGVMLNLIMNDTQKILDASTFLGFTTFGMIASVVVSAIAVIEIGVSALPGVLVIFLAQFVQAANAQGVGFTRKRSVKLTDARVRIIQEILSGVRVVKYNGWTTAFLARIHELRSAELSWIRKGAYLRASASTMKDGVAPVAALVTFTTYVFAHGGTFSAAKGFTILGLYSILVRVYSIAPAGAQALWETKIAARRLHRFLNLPNGNTSSSEREIEEIREIYPQASVVVHNGTFSWHLEQGDSAEAQAHVAGRVSFSISKQVHTESTEANVAEKLARESDLQDEPATLKGINIAVSKGQLTAIVGSVGSGKSSLLQAIIGEMEIVDGGFLINGTVSYAPQQPWIINDTIKNNILFASDYDEARYRRIVTACALDHDISIMPAGDDTEIGEKGVNISGGQKARISLARACYSSSKVVLLDDPLAAVDVPTARHLMNHVLNGVLKGRTVILVTHNKAALELCDKVFYIQNGILKEVGLEEEVIKEILLEADDTQEPEEQISGAEEPRISVSKEVSSIPPSGVIENVVITRMSGDSPQDSRRTSISLKDILDSKDDFEDHEADADHGKDNKQGKATAQQSVGGLTVQEDRVIGEVTWKTYFDFCRGSGLWLWVLVVFLMGFGQAVRVMVDFWISVWVSDKYHLSTRTYLGIYALWVGTMLVAILSRGVIFAEAVIRGAKTMHRGMAESILRSPQLFFDQNPVGRIMNRFSKDQALVDESLPTVAQSLFENLTGVLGVIVLVGVIMPYFLLTQPPFIYLLFYCQRRYVAISRELKRIDGLSRSPIFAHFTQTLQGVTSVRAYGVEKVMHDHFAELLDANNRAYIMFVHTARWLGIRLDFGAACCLMTTALLSVLLRHTLNPGYIGVVLIQSLQLTGFFQYGIRLLADMENLFTSVERNQAYSRLPSEANPKSPPGLITDEWPDKGKVEFVDYTMAYRVDLQPVLNNLTFTVQPQEKIGILGRTGAGKSSLAAALFRMVENSACSGSILIDDIDVKLVGLDDLRLRLSIIPQDPVLFRGTVRLNLDPFHRHSDAAIHEALGKVELTKKIKTLEAGLDSTVTENGENFSVGQRQLLCLARSLLRKSKIIVMDEATAAVDGETDQLIQKTMKTVFQDCTVMTIAHRIDTVIDCDRVLVLAKGGRIAEFDSPLNLLKHAEQVNLSDPTTTSEEHVFANMVYQAGPALAKQLREAAEAAQTRRNARQGPDFNSSSRDR
ncbi:unnamed protein product [Calypogeia fissa]